MLKNRVAKIILHRGSGRRVKRYLFYAVAYRIFAEQIAFNFGGNKEEWLSKVGQRAAEMLLSFFQEQIEQWLFDSVLRGKL